MTSNKCFVCNSPSKEHRLIGTSFNENNKTVDIYVGLCEQHTMEDVRRLQKENPYSWVDRPHDEIGNE